MKSWTTWLSLSGLILASCAPSVGAGDFGGNDGSGGASSRGSPSTSTATVGGSEIPDGGGAGGSATGGGSSSTSSLGAPGGAGGASGSSVSSSSVGSTGGAGSCLRCPDGLNDPADSNGEICSSSLPFVNYVASCAAANCPACDGGPLGSNASANCSSCLNLECTAELAACQEH